jgi:hypothetical protein
MNSIMARREFQYRGSGVQDVGARALSLPAQVVELADDEEDQTQP